MAKRRQFGSVRKLPSGRFQARYVDSSGLQQSADRTFETKRHAADYLASVQADLARGEWRDPRLARLTFAEWSERYLSTGIHKKASTRAQDRHVLRKHLLPAFGALPMGAITPDHVRNFIVALDAQGLAPSTIRSIATKLRAILNSAVESDVISRSPFRGVRLPTNRQPTIRIVEPHELERLAQAVTGDYYAMVYLAGVCGLRFGEVAGLRLGRIDFLQKRLSIEETRSQIGGFSTPKTKASRRTIPLPAVVVEILASHVASKGLKAQDAEALVFTSPRGGPLQAANWHKRTWAPAIEATGLQGLTFHSLRHSAAATMIQLGAHPKVIQDRLGHEDVRTTLDTYGHVFEQVDTELNGFLDSHFRTGASPKSSVRAI